MTKAPTSQNFRSYTGALKPARNTEGEAARTARQSLPQTTVCPPSSQGTGTCCLLQFLVQKRHSPFLLGPTQLPMPSKEGFPCTVHVFNICSLQLCCTTPFSLKQRVKQAENQRNKCTHKHTEKSLESLKIKRNQQWHENINPRMESTTTFKQLLLMFNVLVLFLSTTSHLERLNL